MYVPLITPYLRWLQKDNPTGEVEAYPEISPRYESTLPGVYIVGDLTGVPLLKMAAEGGAKVIRQFLADKDFQSRRQAKPAGVLDVLIIGGGPAGVACALACEKASLDYLLLESTQLFSTLENFPKGKLILAKPDGYGGDSPLDIRNGHKESLLEDLHRQIQGKPLRVQAGTRATAIRPQQGKVAKQETPGKQGTLEVETDKGSLKALRVVVAIGKTGDSRRLKVSGEDLPHVFNRLFDPGEFHGEDILVVGGGDTAVEAAVALAESGNRVTLSYRKEKLDRPKEENQARLESLAREGRITPLFLSEVKEIRPETVRLATGKGEKVLPFRQVFVLIGRELPLAFFKRSGIRMAGQKDRSWYVFLAAMLSFFSMLYFGKAGLARDHFQGSSGVGDKVWAYLSAPFTLRLPWATEHYAWYASLNFYLGWLGSLVFLATGAWALGIMIGKHRKYFGAPWARLKYGYLIGVALAYTGVYFHFMLGRNAGWVEEPTYFYSLFYSTTILLFGIRRALVKKTRYIRYQMLTLAVVQCFFLFLLPFHLFEPLIKANFSPDGYVMREMFPAGKWSCFGFVLFWPLDMNDFGTSGFWTWFPFVQTFGILFLIVKQWGKGAYCGWICSCGGMAETLGDEYRSLAPHGKRAKGLDNIGQAVLAFALVVTAMGYVSRHFGGGPSPWADTLRGFYKLGIDVFFAGVLGLGLYFFLSGRVWCRFGCPLAALMHVYSRFSVYRIFAEKKKCISCNICTKVCHMGIDVMNYANKGIPMNDVQCVRCSACVQACPTEVLGFGKVARMDTDNRDRQEVPAGDKEDWRAGLR